MTQTWRVLLVDDDDGIHASVTDFAAVAEAVDGGTYSIECVSDFDEGLRRLVTSPPDIVILDVRSFHVRVEAEDDQANDDDIAGRLVYERLSKHRFVPVVFYTAGEHLVRDLHDPPLRFVQRKTDGLVPLFRALDNVIESGLPALLRDLDAHVATVICQYVGEYVRGHWQQLNAAGVTAQHLGRQLVELLATSLRRAATQETGDDLAQRLSLNQEWHPALYYVHPPARGRLDTGDIVRLEEDLFGIVITPSCTLEHQKYDTLNMVAAQPVHVSGLAGNWLSEAVRLAAAGSDRRPENHKRMKSIVAGQDPRYFFLPSYLDVVPSMIVDVERTLPLSKDRAGELTAITSLSERYRAALLAHRERYFQRVGLSDPPVEAVLESLVRASAEPPVAKQRGGGEPSVADEIGRRAMSGDAGT
ncbi:hypothetical protein ACGFIG_10405 [Micromonospora sp. NPDC049048]|uniref:hypothetical protein n=1 Tax=Micromonospora sp. NPDC049048 TaxID=3364263 RepID=UPI0037151114